MTPLQGPKLIVVVVLLLACGREERRNTPEPPTTAATTISTRSPSAIQPFDSSDLVVAGLHQSMDSATVTRLLGRPDSVSEVPDIRDPGAKLAEWHYKELSASMGSVGMLGGVSITGGTVPTRRGLRLGDSRARLVRLYGLAPDTSGNTWQYETKDGLYVMQVDFVAGVVRRVYLGILYD